MKILIFAITIFALSNPALGWHDYFTDQMELDQEGVKELVEILRNCVEETDLNPETFLGKTSVEFPKSKELSAFYNCVAINYGLCDNEDDETFDLSVLDGKLTHQKQKILVECGQKHEKPCGNIFQVHQCYETQLKEVKADL